MNIIFSESPERKLFIVLSLFNDTFKLHRLCNIEW